MISTTAREMKYTFFGLSTFRGRVTADIESERRIPGWNGSADSDLLLHGAHDCHHEVIKLLFSVLIKAEIGPTNRHPAKWLKMNLQVIPRETGKYTRSGFSTR